MPAGIFRRDRGVTKRVLLSTLTHAAAGPRRGAGIPLLPSLVHDRTKVFGKPSDAHGAAKCGAARFLRATVHCRGSEATKPNPIPFVARGGFASAFSASTMTVLSCLKTESGICRTCPEVISTQWNLPVCGEAESRKIEIFFLPPPTIGLENPVGHACALIAGNTMKNAFGFLAVGWFNFVVRWATFFLSHQFARLAKYSCLPMPNDHEARPVPRPPRVEPWYSHPSTFMFPGLRIALGS